MKVCRCCKVEKSENEFYRAITKCGLGSYCKDCQKEKVKESRTKYWGKNKNIEKRLNYNKTFDWSKYYSKRKLLRMQYPEKLLAQTSVRYIKTAKGIEKHHWSYNEEHYLDIIQLSYQDHRLLHKRMVYDQEQKMFRKLDGVLLDTKESHIEYMGYLKNKGEFN